MNKLINNKAEVLVLAFIIVLIPMLLPAMHFLSVFVFAGIHAIMAIGLVLLVGYTGQISLGHAGFFAIGAYTSAILSSTYGFSPWLSIFIAIVFTMLIGLIIGLPTLRLKGYYLALATLAFGLIVLRLILKFRDLTGGAIGLRGIPRLSLGEVVIRSDLAFYFLVWFIVLVVFSFVLSLTRSPFVTFLKGIHYDEVAMSVVGLNVSIIKLKVFIFSTALAGLAGALYSHYVTYISPDTFVMERSILLVMMVLIGGSKHPWGGIIGALFLTFVPEHLRAYRDLAIGFYGLLLMLLILYMPGGIAPLLEKGLLFIRDKGLSKGGGYIAK